MKEEFTEQEKSKFAKAQELSRQGNVLGTIDILKELVKSNPTSATFSVVLGNALWDTGDLVLAEAELRKAVKLAPLSERNSLVLFHYLWEQNKKDEAFEEMKRFRAIAECADYDEIVKEINSRNDL